MGSHTTIVPSHKWRVFVEAVCLPCPDEECGGWMLGGCGDSSTIPLCECEPGRSVIRCDMCGLQTLLPHLVLKASAKTGEKESPVRVLGSRKLTMPP